MTRPIAVLRPEPGNRVTASAIEAAGRSAIRLPLFAVHALDWEVPDPHAFDTLLLTSANALRHAGPGLAALRALPVHAVGTATAEAARRAGFAIASVGDAGAEALLVQAEAAGVRRALHLAGRDRSLEPGGIVAAVRATYASDPIGIGAADAAQLAGSIALVQSARAGARLAEITDAHGLDSARIALVAVSERAAEAAGTGWERRIVAPAPDGEAMVAAALALAD